MQGDSVDRDSMRFLKANYWLARELRLMNDWTAYDVLARLTSQTKGTHHVYMRNMSRNKIDSLPSL